MCPIGQEGSRLRQEGSRVRKEGSRVRDGPRVREGSRARQEIPEEGRRTHRPKRCIDNNEDEDNSPNNTNNTKKLQVRMHIQITVNTR